MLLQHLLEIPARVTGGMLGNLFWGARHHDLSSLVSPFWTEIHDPVGTADHVEVVLDHQEIAVSIKDSEERFYRYPHMYPQTSSRLPYTPNSYE